jgi:hypothetical protein
VAEINADFAAQDREGEPPRCKPWCGTEETPPNWQHTWYRNGRWFCTGQCFDAERPIHPREGEPGRCDKSWCGSGFGTVAYCSDACRDAGKPIHPGEGEQRRCGAVGYPKKDTP